jgi:hypothetical protein
LSVFTAKSLPGQAKWQVNQAFGEGEDGESAGARTQDQRLKRAMLYQLSYALKPHYQVSTFSRGNFAAKHQQRMLLQAIV